MTMVEFRKIKGTPRKEALGMDQLIPLDGKLYVTISSSMIRSHLEFQKPSLIQAMNRFLEKDELFVKDYDKVGFVKELILK